MIVTPTGWLTLARSVWEKKLTRSLHQAYYTTENYDPVPVIALLGKTVFHKTIIKPSCFGSWKYTHRRKHTHRVRSWKYTHRRKHTHCVRSYRDGFRQWNVSPINELVQSYLGHELSMGDKIKYYLAIDRSIVFNTRHRDVVSNWDKAPDYQFLPYAFVRYTNSQIRLWDVQ